MQKNAYLLAKIGADTAEIEHHLDDNNDNDDNSNDHSTKSYQ